MKIDLSGKKVLITGSTAGIGFAAAAVFLRAGAEVVINGRSTERVDEAISKLRHESESVVGFAGDLSTEAESNRLISLHPEVDILINNLGIFGPQDYFSTPDEEWLRFFNTNVMSGVRLSRAYAPSMINKGWGRIIFVSSESALNIPADMIHYGLTKTAQLAVSRGLAKRLAGSGVTVNAVLPGPTLSEGVEAMLQRAGASEGEIEQAAADFVVAHRGSSIIRRAATVDEVANMILYASSHQASATTGAALRVDGGVVDTIA